METIKLIPELEYEALYCNYVPIFEILQDAQQHFERTYSYPIRASKPVKPLAPSKGSSQEFKEFAEKLEKWEAENAVYVESIRIYREHQQLFNEVCEKLIKEASGLNEIPEKYRSKVWSLAWERGHSSGYYEVYLNLQSLVEIFTD